VEHVALWWTGAVRRHPGRILAGALVVTLVLAGGLTQLRFDSSESTMIPSGSTVYTDNVRYQRQFGSDPMVIVFAGANRDLLAGRNLTELRGLQRRLEQTGVYHAVLGPLTALGFAADQLPIAPGLALGALTRAQAAAGTAEQRARIAADFSARTAGDASRVATVGAHSLDNPAFVDFLIHDATGVVRPSLRGVFPDDHHALMVVRLGGRLDIDAQAAAAERVVALTRATHFTGVRAVATGSPLLVKEINDRMRGDMAMLGASAALAMAAVLLLVFRVRWRLLSLGVMVLGVAWGFGAMGYLGLPLTMVTISGLPILIGLGVDFAVQIHSRYESELGVEPDPGVDGALRRTFLRLGPAISVAAVAAVVGFLVLRTSGVPMVRDYGLLLSIGTAASLVAALAVLPAVLSWRDQRREWRQPREGHRRVERTTRVLSTAGVGHRGTVLGVSLVIVAVGTVAVGRTALESDPERWVPQDSAVLRDLRDLRRVAGSSADLALMVEAPDVLRPDVLHWMYQFQTRATRRHADQLVSSNSVASIAAEVTFAEPTPEDVRAVMAVAPDAIRRTFIGDGGTRAQILFAIGPISLEQRKELVAQLVSELHAPPGVTIRPSGLAVVGTEAVTSLTSSRESMSYLALGAVFLWLLLAFRSLRRALLVVLPVASAVALGATVIYIFGIRVNTLAAISGPLVIATCTEFTVLIMERYLEERREGRPAARAVETASFHIGRAFVASGLTTAAGFGVLALSGFPLLSGFGVVVALNVVVALVCALVILPPLLLWSGDRATARIAPIDHMPVAQREEVGAQ
jgi:hydrophobe/amphiphile efflux-3 (HAE3) family protein